MENPEKEVNDTIENFDLFESYIGIDDLNCSYGSRTNAYNKHILKNFIELRAETRRKLKALYHIARRIRYTETHKVHVPAHNTISKQGLQVIIYSSNEPHYLDNQLYLYPLAWINTDYRNSMIHALEIQMCYINKNIKAIKAALRRRLDKYGRPL